MPLVGELTIGRAPGATLVLSDPTVSRVHARITGDGVLEDAGSSHGTYLDGTRLTGPSPLHDGAKIRLGDAELRVERRRGDEEAGRTIVVRPGASLLMPAAGAASLTGSGMRKRSKRDREAITGPDGRCHFQTRFFNSLEIVSMTSLYVRGRLPAML